MQAVVSQKPYTERCLECRIDHRQIAIPLIFVDQLLAYDRKPLPLAATNVGGVGIHEGYIVISVCLKLTFVRTPITTKAVLFRGAPGKTLWALEVDETLAFVDVTRQEGASHPTDQPWMTPATSSDGRAFDWLDVEHLTSTLSVQRAT
jgi:hypothetical protein